MKNQTHLPIILSLLILPFWLAAQEKEVQWTPEFSMQFKQISASNLSPDSQQIAFLSGRSGEPRG